MGIALMAGVMVLIIIIAAVYFSQQRANQGTAMMDDNTGELDREDAFGYVKEIEEGAEAGPEGDDNRLDR
jgi:hypothetical protein